MNVSFDKRLTVGIIIVLTISILLLTLSFCDLFDDFSYVADDKDEIKDNIDSSDGEDEDGETVEFEYVYKYLRHWGMPIFDTLKFINFENCFITYYNYEKGMPDTATHANDTAEMFMELYYDDIDHSDKTAVTNAMLMCYVESLDDPYAVFREPEETEDYNDDMSGKFGGIGVVVEYNYEEETIMVNTVYIDSPAERAGVQVGDYLHAVDGKTIEELGLVNAVYHVRGEIGTYVELTLLRGDEYITIKVLRDEVEEINAAYDYDEETGIGYIQIVSFKDNTFAQFAEAVDALKEAGAKGIIFDVRGNPGGYLYSVCDVISYLIPTGHSIVTYQYKNQPVVELKSEDDEVDGVTRDHVLDIPIVVLCNEYTASAGEIFTAALRDYTVDGIVDATIVGTNTFGKGIMQNSFSYFDGSSATFTIAYYNPPCGDNYHEIGVAPDVEVENTETEDLQLNEAMKILSETITK